MDVHKLQVSIEGDASKLKQAAREATREVKQMTGAINNDLKQIKSPAEALANDKSTQQIRNMRTIIRKSFADMKSGLIPKAVTSGLKDYVKQVQMASGLRVYTDDYLEISKDMEKANSELDKLQAKMAEMKGSGVDQESAAFTRLQEKIERCRYETEGCNRELEELRASGEDTKLNIDTSGATGKIKAVVATVKEVVSNIPVIGKVARATGSIASKAFSGMVAVLKKISPAIKKAGGVFGSLIQRFAQGIPLLGRFNSGAKQSGNAFGSSLKTLLKYGIGIRSLFVLFNRLRSAMVDGFKNLAQYSTTTNNSLSTLQSGLNQLKNSLATAFAPILDVIAPILNTLISYLVAATNAIGQFFAALTGKGSYTVAKRVATDFAAGANSAGDAAGNAADQAERLKRTLMGFDEINKLDDDSSSGSSGGSGGSGGSGAGDMFSTETVTNEFANWADLVKQAWADADFSEIGNILGEKLKEGLENIPWNRIKEGAQKVGKSLATLINGFVETSGLGGMIGKTVAEGINTGVLGIDSFLTNLHWESVGTFIADSLNGFVKKTSWSDIGKTVGDGINGVFRLAATWSGKFDFTAAGNAVKTAVNTALSGIKWTKANTAAENIGAGIANGLNSVMTTETFGNVGKTLANVIETVVSGAYSFIGTIHWTEWGDSIAEGLNQFFKNFPSKKLADAANGLAHGLTSAVSHAFSELNWYEVGKAVGDFFARIEWKDILHDIAELIKEAARGLPQAALGLFDAIKEGLNDVTWEDIADIIVDGLTVYLLLKAPALGAKLIAGMFGVGAAGAAGGAAASGTAAGGAAATGGWLAKVAAGAGIGTGTAASIIAALTGAFALAFDTTKIADDTADPYYQQIVAEEDAKAKNEAKSRQDGERQTQEDRWNADNSGEIRIPTKAELIGIEDKIPSEQKKVSGIAGWIASIIKDVKINPLAGIAATVISVAKGNGIGVLAGIGATISSLAKSGNPILAKIGATVSGLTKSGNPTLAKIIASVSSLTKSGNPTLSKITAAVNSITNPHGKSVSAKVNVTGQVNTPTLSARLNVTTTGRGIHVTGGTITLATGGIYSGGQWRPITTAASGGAFSAGQMFIAREAGPELVGRIGSNTAVMNNNQIVSSVAAGVYQAVTAAMSQFASKGNSGSTPEIRVYVGGKEVTDVVIKDVNSRTRTTGVCPILT